jgi:hypothetical protein
MDYKWAIIQQALFSPEQCGAEDKSIFSKPLKKITVTEELTKKKKERENKYL